jgi:hypothetical protein
MYEIKIYKSKWQAVKIILLGSPFVAIALYDILTHSIDMPRALDWSSLCFFGLCIPLGLYNLFDNRPEIIINNTGIFDRQTTRDFVNWNLIENAFVKEMRVSALSKQVFLCIMLIPGANPPLKRLKFLNKANKSMGYGDISISVSQLKKQDWPKLAYLIKEMAHASISEKQKLLLNYEQ